MVLFEGAQEILVATIDLYAIVIWGINCFNQWLGNCTIYLYSVLDTKLS